MTRAETIALEYLKEANGDYRRALIEIAKNYALTLAWLEQAERKAADHQKGHGPVPMPVMQGAISR